MEKDKEFYVKEVKDRFKACHRLARKLNAKQFCQAMYCCLSSQYSEYEEFCEGCPFIDCCIMNESPDTMLNDIFGRYEYLPEEVDNRETIEKSKKYDKIKELLKGELDE